MRKGDTIPSTLFRLPGVENKRNSIHVMHRFRPWNVAFFGSLRYNILPTVLVLCSFQ